MENKIKKFFKKISNIFWIDLKIIALAGILVALGILVNVFFRINNTTFLTFAFYIILGLILPLFLALVSGILIDIISMVLRGQIFFWHWSFFLGIIIIIVLASLFKFVNCKIYKRLSVLIFSFILLLIIFFGLIIFIIRRYQYNPSLFEVNNFFLYSENNQLFWEFLSFILIVAGFLFIIIFFLFQIIYYLLKQNNQKKLIIFIMIILISLLYDIFYIPWAFNQWRKTFINIKSSSNLSNFFILVSLKNAIINISFSTPVIFTFYYVYENSNFIKKNIYF